MSNTQCAIQGCKTTLYNKATGVHLHPCPTSSEMRKKWSHALKYKCPNIDWAKSRICSKHFQNKYFDSQRKLKDNAIPNLFPILSKYTKYNDYSSNEYVDKVLSKLTQADLVEDINNSMTKITEPANFSKMVTEDLKSKPEATNEAQLWLLVKKQNHLNTRLLELVTQNKKHVQVLQKNMEENRSSKMDQDQNVETYKYIVKCLQEKLATLEEQIEILTAVESR